VNDVNIGPVKTSVLPERDGYHHGHLRNALIEAAARLVGDKGPEAFSLREAAREVGVSPAAAYRHFADKLALMTAMSVEAHGRLAQAMERALGRVEGKAGTRAHAVRSILAIAQAYVEFAVRNPSHFKVMFGACFSTEDFEPGCAPSGRDAFQILLDVLDGLVASGAIRPEARLGAELVAWSGVHGLAGLLVSGALPLPPRARQAATLTVARTQLLGMGVAPELLPAVEPISVDPRVLHEREAAAGLARRRA